MSLTISLYYSRDQKHQKKECSLQSQDIFLNSFILSNLPALPFTADLSLDLTSFYYFTFLSPHLTSNTRLCSFALFFSSSVLYRCGSIWAYNRWGRLGWHPQGYVCVAAARPAGRLCAYVCSCVCVSFLMCSVTLPLCLPATFRLHSLIPEGHSHTEKFRRTHRGNLPVTFHILLIES